MTKNKFTPRPRPLPKRAAVKTYPVFTKEETVWLSVVNNILKNNPQSSIIDVIGFANAISKGFKKTFPQ